ncbi:DegT/DnrJ/EryC1/StrS family aminotransferase [Laspinema sp. D3]|nr:DegT/DnrJ/EryC1/StrS family aminotransferase [Laspinema sp. D2c]
MGYNDLLDTLESAILRVTLLYLEQWNEGRRRGAKACNELFVDMAGIITPELADGHVFHQYTVWVLDGTRNKLKEYLGEQGIGSMIYYPVPQDQLPVYQGQYPKMPVSDLLGTEVLSLPICPELEQHNINLMSNLCKTGLLLD